jgi:two-component system nitrogen regulation response regulator NtrX
MARSPFELELGAHLGKDGRRMAKCVLIVDDELDIQSSLAFALKDEGYEVFTASSPLEAEQILASHNVDIGLYDVWFPEGDGIELLKLSRQKYPNATIILMSGHGNIELALKAIRMGAYDFLEKPLELEKVLVVLRNAAEALELRDENKRLNREIVGRAQIIGHSPAIEQLRLSIQKASTSNSHVLILGENGSGKELVAHQLHRESARAEKPFIAVNCAAVPEPLFESELFGHEKGAFTGASSRQLGRFEQAGSGMLFLDEISELSLSAQGKLLRVLEERRFERIGGRQSIKNDARIVAATNRDLQHEVRQGRFREDLYFRLNVLALHVPPLRARDGDVELLARHFVESFSKEYGRATPALRPELLEWMHGYEWPGNVRELKNLIERMLIMGSHQPLLGLSDLPEELQPTTLKGVAGTDLRIENLHDPMGTLRELRAAFERTILEQRLDKLGGNVTRAAESLGIERAHLHRKLKQYGLSNGKDMA